MSDAPVTRVVSLDQLPFEHRFTAELPADPDDTNRRRQVQGALYSRVAPTPVAGPRTVAWSPEVAALLGIDPEVCASQDFAEVFGGNRVPAGADPHATVYGGHQFGSWAGQLGDGRAIALGEVRDVSVDARRCSSRVRAPRPTPARPTGAPCCGRRCGSSCAARPCTTSACRPPVRSRW
jgi:serine/tyrosine/threonine adenylyltransferase